MVTERLGVACGLVKRGAYRGTFGGDGHALIPDYMATFIAVYVFRNSTNRAVRLVCEFHLNEDDSFFFFQEVECALGTLRLGRELQPESSWNICLNRCFL